MSVDLAYNPRTDAFAILEVAPNVSYADARRSYRRLASQNHPDKNHHPEAKERMQLINSAWEVLQPSVRPTYEHNRNRYLQWQQQQQHRAYRHQPEDVFWDPRQREEERRRQHQHQEHLRRMEEARRRKEEALRKMEECRRQMEECLRQQEEFRRQQEEFRRRQEEGRRRQEEWLRQSEARRRQLVGESEREFQDFMRQFHGRRQDQAPRQPGGGRAPHHPPTTNHSNNNDENVTQPRRNPGRSAKRDVSYKV